MIEEYIQNDYLRFVAVVLGIFIILQLTVFFIKKIVEKLVKKSSTQLDDIILEKTREPITYLLFLIGLKISIRILPLAKETYSFLEKGIGSLIILVSFYLGYFIVNLLVGLAWKNYSRKSNKAKNQGLYYLVESTLKVALVIAALLSLLSYLGVEVGPLIASLGIGGVAIAFAMQSSLANVFGGISIILDKTVRVGDLVNLKDNVAGKITRIGLRSTKIKTFDNEIIIIPNSKLANENVLNVAQPEPKSRVVIPFGVAYGSNIEKVKKIVLGELKKIEGFIEVPSPSVKFLEMGDSALKFKAYFFVESFEKRFGAIDEANTRIYNALNRAKIKIPFPQMDVHIKEKD